MISPTRGRPARLLAASLCALFPLVPTPSQAEDAVQLHEVTVTGTREGELKSETPAAISTIKGATIEAVKPAHPSEIVSRVPGAVMMPTNGEGHTTGIRQPIGTDAVYSYLEDGIPTRATGFFNHNALFEVNVPQADGIEVTRGPGSALQGSDAIGAVFNVLTKAPSATPEAKVTAEAGSFGWMRFLGTASDTFGDTGLRGDLNLTHTDGWRDKTEYNRQSATFRVDSATGPDTTIKALVSATNADMDTGANARLTKTDYQNNPTANYHSIAFRRVAAFRASVAVEHETGDDLVSLTPFVRYNQMDLLPTYQLSSDPVIQNSGHASLGLQARWRRDFTPWRTRLITGADLDYSPGWHSDDRISTSKSGSYFTGYSRGATIYDYDVTYMQASPYVHGETSPIPDLRLSAGLRGDIMRYDYDNHLSTGAFASGLGTTFYRPGSTTRDYSHLSPSLGATYALDPALNVFGRYKHSFRAPSESQLFRSGATADTLHLQPVKVDNYEMGLRGPDKGAVTWEVAAYRMIKRDDILSLKENGTTTAATNNGKTRHYGVEAALGWQFLPDWRVDGSTSYARHRYVSWVATSGNTTSNYSGNDISLAPRTVSSLALGWSPKSGDLAGLTLEGEWTHLGPYKMDDANTNTYQGHHLFNLRGAYQLTDDIEVFGRVMNLLDTRWATVAQFTSNREEFAPGLPRTIFAGITARF